jgi:(2Fe-2S) ferredoxin
MAPRRCLILVCRGPECGDKRNSAGVHAELKRQIGALPPSNVEVHLDWQSCFGKCARGVNVMVRELRTGEEAMLRALLVTGQGGTVYNAVKPEEVDRILREHVVGGRVIDEFKRRE